VVDGEAGFAEIEIGALFAVFPEIRTRRTRWRQSLHPRDLHEELFVGIERQSEGAIREIVSLIHRSREEQVTPAVAAALLVGLIANWEKITR
jgi:hypothetical protein